MIKTFVQPPEWIIPAVFYMMLFITPMFIKFFIDGMEEKEK